MLDSWWKDLARHQKEERAALGREHAKSAREYERGVRQTATSAPAGDAGAMALYNCLIGVTPPDG